MRNSRPKLRRFWHNLVSLFCHQHPTGKTHRSRFHMRMSKLFFQTLREAPAEAEIISHQLMVRASMIQPIAAGIFDILPLAQRVKHKIENIMRDEIDAIGGQEVSLPV